MITKKLSFLLATIFSFSGTLTAQVLKNEDFSNGHSYWEGGGKVVFLNDAGEPVSAENGGKPALEVKLAKTQVTEIRQRFTLAHTATGVKASTVVKASPDFKRNDNAPRWTKDITWRSGGWYSWSALVYPKADFCMRVDAGSGYHYLPRALKAGGNWQTLRGEFRDMKSQGGKVFTFVLPAGEGTIWIQSVKTEAL